MGRVSKNLCGKIGCNQVRALRTRREALKAAQQAEMAARLLELSRQQEWWWHQLTKDVYDQRKLRAVETVPGNMKTHRQRASDGWLEKRRVKWAHWILSLRRSANYTSWAVTTATDGKNVKELYIHMIVKTGRMDLSFILCVKMVSPSETMTVAMQWLECFMSGYFTPQMILWSDGCWCWFCVEAEQNCFVFLAVD